MKKLLLVSLILVVPLTVRAEHEACAAVVPPPPGCLHHDDADNDNDNDKVFIGAALVLGGYYLFSQKDSDVESRYNLVSGLNLFRKGKFEINSLALPAYNFRLQEHPTFTETRFNLISFNYQFDR